MARRIDDDFDEMMITTTTEKSIKFRFRLTYFYFDEHFFLHDELNLKKKKNKTCLNYVIWDAKKFLKRNPISCTAFFCIFRGILEKFFHLPHLSFFLSSLLYTYLSQFPRSFSVCKSVKIWFFLLLIIFFNIFLLHLFWKKFIYLNLGREELHCCRHFVNNKSFKYVL